MNEEEPIGLFEAEKHAGICRSDLVRYIERGELPARTFVRSGYSDIHLVQRSDLDALVGSLTAKRLARHRALKARMDQVAKEAVAAAPRLSAKQVNELSRILRPRPGELQFPEGWREVGSTRSTPGSGDSSPGGTNSTT